MPDFAVKMSLVLSIITNSTQIISTIYSSKIHPESGTPVLVHDHNQHNVGFTNIVAVLRVATPRRVLNLDKAILNAPSQI